MNLDSRVEKVESQVLGGSEELTLCKLLSFTPDGNILDDNGKRISLRQLFLDRLPHIGVISTEQFLDVLPSKFKAELVELIKEDYEKENEQGCEG